ncbi:MAG TPA: hypothetical protein PLQ89_05470 [Phycisphaerae bacterium]|nr:hypothetical protein [Phycisphaerae bacterium]HOJ75134.1 hypothetical protein [Phycisphaerae bacterium]HOM52364.1 hypothetical protein [Phycisphaerae bacterium]HON64943.1 hypothetical protein [Phycisphaerae bacterium]HOQ85150.1 hypothetical protein [Phycisphaerae bacterium]
MANAPQDFFSNWLRTTTQLTEATLRATAEAQLANLDRWMETMVIATRMTRRGAEQLPGFAAMKGEPAGKPSDIEGRRRVNPDVGRVQPPAEKAERSEQKLQRQPEKRGRSAHEGQKKTGSTKSRSSATKSSKKTKAGRPRS